MYFQYFLPYICILRIYTLCLGKTFETRSMLCSRLRLCLLVTPVHYEHFWPCKNTTGQADWPSQPIRIWTGLYHYWQRYPHFGNGLRTFSGRRGHSCSTGIVTSMGIRFKKCRWELIHREYFLSFFVLLSRKDIRDISWIIRQDVETPESDWSRPVQGKNQRKSGAVVVSIRQFRDK